MWSSKFKNDISLVSWCVKIWHRLAAMKLHTVLIFATLFLFNHYTLIATSEVDITNHLWLRRM